MSKKTILRKTMDEPTEPCCKKYKQEPIVISDSETEAENEEETRVETEEETRMETEEETRVETEAKTVTEIGVQTDSEIRSETRLENDDFRILNTWIGEDDNFKIVDEFLGEYEDFRVIDEYMGEVEDFTIVDELMENLDGEDYQFGGAIIDEPEIERDLFGCHQILKINVSRLNMQEIKLPDSLLKKLFDIVNELQSVKIQFGIHLEFAKDGEFKLCRISNKAGPLSDSFFEEGIRMLNEKISIRSELGSSWILNRILEINFKITKVSDINRLSGHSYIKLPKGLADKKAVVNIKNSDNFCFLYSILAILKQDVITSHLERVNNYERFLSELNYNENDMPMRLVNIPKFEAQNPGLAINVLSWNEKMIIDEEDMDRVVMKHPNVDIIHRSKVVDGKPIYLILLEANNNFHYVAVTNINRLLNMQYTCNTRIQSIWCKNCLNGFRRKLTFENHQTICNKNQTGTTLYNMPEDKNLIFKDYSKMITPVYVIYADFESVLPADINYHQKHLPISAGLLLINNITNERKYHQFIGYDCVLQFLMEVENIAQNIVIPYYKTEGRKPMHPLSIQEEKSFIECTTCYLCKKQIVNPVRDHDHFTGKYQGAACSKCNLTRKIKINLPVIFHNLKGYDMHHILKYGINKFQDWNITCIPTTNEKFLALIVHIKNVTVKFIDSYQFINSSLDKAVSTLQQLPLTTTEFNSNLINSKGIFPYNFATSLEVLESTTTMPTIWEDVTEDAYTKAVLIWEQTNCKSLLDYMLVYLKLDVFLLADFFQQFREKSIAHNKLEPLNFFGIPGMSWASALMTLKEPIELITDNDMYNFFEGGIRGGLTFVNKHHILANENTELLYIDINNLYGWALIQKLPYGGFQWVETDDESFSKILQECKESDLESLPYGYTIEVDLIIPEEIHDYLSDLPVAAEKKCPPGSKVTKLLLTHHNKKNYVIHWRLLQIYLHLGVQVSKIHRAVKFNQENIFKDYVDTNTNLRANSKDELDKNYYKLLNNSLYGKTVENLKKRINLRICNTAQKLLTQTSKATFRKSTKIDDDLIAVLMNKEAITLDRPSYIGQSVLDLSKLRMYQLQYVDLAKYRQQFECEINIVAGDTDSFFLECKYVKLEELLAAMVNDNLLDTSNYNINHPLYSKKLDSIIGKFKDESKGIRYKEWVFLRPKCYSLLSEKETIKAKGISLKDTGLNHQQYFECYNSNLNVSVPQFRIGSKNHQLFSFKGFKVALSNKDDKRNWVGKNLSFPYGHYIESISDEIHEGII